MIRPGISVLLLFFTTYVQAVGPPAGTDLQPKNPDTAQTAVEPSKPQFDLMDETHILAGKRRFGSNCAAYCHGNEGVGGRTPSFKGRTDLTQEAIFKMITEGGKGADAMPTFRGMTEEKRWELVAYILSLGRQPADPQPNDH